MDNHILRYGYGTVYYSEVTCRIGEILALRSDLIAMLKQNKPELLKALQDTLKEMLKKVGS